MEWLHRVILNMLATEYIDNKVFDYIYPWGETLEYIAWDYKDLSSPQYSVRTRPRCLVVDMIFNLASVVDWGGGL